MNESGLSNKDVTLFYLRHCLREIGSGLYDQDLETTSKVDRLMSELRNAIAWIESLNSLD